MKTRHDIEQAVAGVAHRYGAQSHWGREDGITWLTLFGGNIQPKIFDEITCELSRATGVDCYFNKCGINDIEIALNANLEYGVEPEDIPKTYLNSHIEKYGTLFK